VFQINTVRGLAGMARGVTSQAALRICAACCGETCAMGVGVEIAAVAAQTSRRHRMFMEEAPRKQDPLQSATSFLQASTCRVPGRWLGRKQSSGHSTTLGYRTRGGVI
jgi:hypothetical protein